MAPHDFRDGLVYSSHGAFCPTLIPRETGGAVIRYGSIDRRRGDINSVVMVYIDPLTAKLSLKT